MAREQNIASITYVAAWVLTAIAFVYKLLLFTQQGHDLALRISIFPVNFFQASLLFFVICIAADTRTRASGG